MKNLPALVLFCFFSTGLLSQKPEVVVQLGHSDRVNVVAFSPNGQFLISGGGDNAVKIWDIKTGLLIRTLSGHKWPIKSIACSVDGKYILSGSEDDYAKLWELSSGKLIKTLPIHLSDVETVLFSPNGKLMATVGGKEIKIWDVNGSWIRTISGHTEGIGSISFNADGSQLVAGEDGYASKSIKIWDPNSGKLLKTISGIEDGIAEIQFSASGGEILCAAGGGYRDGSILLFNAQTGARLHSKKDSSGVWTAKFSRDGKSFFWGGPDGKLKISDTKSGNLLRSISLKEVGALYNLSLSSDGRYLACAVGWRIIIYDLNPFKVVRELATRSDYVWSLALANDGQFMAAASGHIDGGQTIKLWDIRQGKLIKSYKGHTSWILSVAIGSDQRFIGSGSDDKTLAYWEMPGVKSVNTFRPSSGNVNAGNQKINAVAFHPGGKYLAGATADGSILYLRAGRSTFQKMESSNKGFASICFSPDGKTIAAGTNNGRVELWDVEAKIISKTITSHAYDYNVLDSAEAIPYGSILSLNFGNSTINTVAVSAVAFSPDGKILASAGGSDIKIWDATSQTLIKTLPKNAGLTSIAFSHNGQWIAAGGADQKIRLWDVATGNLLQTFVGHQHEVRSVVFSKEDKFIYSGSLDTQIKVWDLALGKEALSYLSISNSDDFIAITPEGYYLSSKGASKVLAFRVGNKTYPFNQFDLKFHRPDIVLKEISRIAYNTSEGSPNDKLIKSYAAAYEKRLKKMGFYEAMLGSDIQLPEVKIKTANIPTSTSIGFLSLEVEAVDQKYLLDRINVSINDVPVFGVAGIPLKSKKIGVWSQSIQLPLNKGVNEINVSVLNEKGAESLGETHIITYEPTTIEKPDLYILALGVSKYRNDQMNLNFAAKDAKDLVQLFIAQKDSYKKIVVDTLFDHQATTSNILDLRKKLMSTKVDDRVILFIAGHGLIDKNLDYFLATHDVDFGEPSTNGLAYEKLEQLLDGIPARNKILLMDACHSGEIDKEEVALAAAPTQNQQQVKFRAIPGTSVQKIGLENSFELMKELFADLRKGNGTTVISSAGGAEYAMEGAEWNNGIFTYCLLSGLKEKKADLNGDGVVMLSELQRYLTTVVPELTEGKQRPTSRVENLSNDFQIWY